MCKSSAAVIRESHGDSVRVDIVGREAQDGHKRESGGLEGT